MGPRAGPAPLVYRRCRWSSLRMRETDGARSWYMMVVEGGEGCFSSSRHGLTTLLQPKAQHGRSSVSLSSPSEQLTETRGSSEWQSGCLTELCLSSEWSCAAQPSHFPSCSLKLTILLFCFEKNPPPRASHATATTTLTLGCPFLSHRPVLKSE